MIMYVVELIYLLIDGFRQWWMIKSAENFEYIIS